jgi:translation initiation factor 1
MAKLRVEKSGRGGKTVTVVYDLPRNQAFLREVAGELKRACGTGGTVVDNTVELQGDVRERLRALLAKKGWTIKCPWCPLWLITRCEQSESAL